jgi:long-subunit acyl-CoA synthetase (AMP-forming)
MDFDEVTASPAQNQRDKSDLTPEQKTQEDNDSYKRFTPSMNIVNPSSNKSEEQKRVTIEIRKEMVDNLFDQML